MQAKWGKEGNSNEFESRPLGERGGIRYRRICTVLLNCRRRYDHYNPESKRRLSAATDGRSSTSLNRHEKADRLAAAQESTGGGTAPVKEVALLGRNSTENQATTTYKTVNNDPNPTNESC